MSETQPAASETTESTDQQPTEIEVDGERVNLQEAVTALKNKSAWQKEYTQREQSLADQRKQLDGMLNKVIDASQKPAAEPEPEPDLPDPVEDKEAFERSLQQREERAIKKAEQAAQEVAGQAERRMSAARARENIVSENVSMVDRYLDTNFPDISPQERDAVKREVASLGGNQYGTLDKNSNAFRYNEAAVEKATRMVDSIHNRQIAAAQAQARQEGLTGRAQGQSAANAAPPDRPPADASLADKMAYMQTLPPAQYAAAAQGMDADEISALIQQNRENLINNRNR